MHRFQPTRASPPIRPHVLDTSMRTDFTQSINDSIAPELQQLSPNDIEILDAMIRRAGPGATTFFTIFKAYSDVLKERGLDPQEVVYYGKLLKLGTLKGKSWGEKWEMVKAQANPILPVTPTLGSLHTESIYPPYAPSDDDQFSSASQMHVSRNLPKPPAKNGPTSNLAPSKANQSTEKKPTKHKTFALDAKEFPILASIAQRAARMTKETPTTPPSEDEGASSSPVPPSYKSTAFDLTLPPITRNRMSVPEKSISVTRVLMKVAHHPSGPKEKQAVVDLDDAWKNIKMQQDEEFADNFREEILIARCWQMWRQGFLWITTTHQQIGEARDKLLLRVYLQRWQTKFAIRLSKEDELLKRFDVHRTRLFFQLWHKKFKQRRQIAWRNDMRQKLKVMKTRSDTRLVREAWKKWGQLHLGYRANIHYETNLMVRFYSQWKDRSLHLDDMNNLASQFAEGTHYSNLRSIWHKWKNFTSLRQDERAMVLRVNRRIMTNNFDLWRKHLATINVANNFREKSIMKQAVQRWKESMRTIKVLENRAEKHLIRQDDSLLRAVTRIWRARMRGKRLEQFKTTAVLKKSWLAWKSKIDSHRALSDVADKFLRRSETSLQVSTLTRWHKILITHRNAHQYAVEFHATRLRARALLEWRLRLRDTHQAAKVAQWANIYFATRHAWKIWVTAMEERKRQDQLKQWNISRSRKIFNVWRHRAKEGQYFRQCEMIIREGVERRIKSNTLTHWTNRVIEMKSRELDVERRYDISLLKSCFLKWRISHRQHVEEVSLLENYLLVKQEDVLRRAFHRWLTVKRAAETRRLNHQRKEAHLKQVAITSAWEKWRERFKEEKLRPVEYEVILANQKNVLCTAFTLWLSKTYSLPAVKFHSKYLKQKFFDKWKKAMPNALRAKKARETDRYNTIVRTFEKWVRVYKTNITLKAVARAKSLRLPTTSPRQLITKSRPLYVGPQSTYLRKAPSVQDDESQTEDANPRYTRIEHWNSKPRSERSVARSDYTESTQQNDNVDRPKRFVPRRDFIVSKPRSERSVPRSDYGLSAGRQPSPVRSVISMRDRSPSNTRSARIPGSPIQAKRTGEAGTLWSAIKDLPQRRPRNL